MKRISPALSILLGLLAFGGIGWLLFRAIKAFLDYVSAIPKDLGAPIIAGVATVLVATLTVVIGKNFERKRELDALYRDKKTEVYDEFLKTFFEFYFSGGENKDVQDLIPFFREFSRKLILWSGPEVIESFLAWKDHLAKGTPDAKSVFLTEDFLLAVRSDLRHTNKGIRRGLFARMFLKNSDLFLAMAAKNPNYKLEDLVELEKLISQGESPDA